MQQQNQITIVTRKNIADELTIGKIWYNGRLDEPDFLGRVFDLAKLPSTDYRYSNAYEDIFKHTVMNNDWEPDWVFTDSRLNLLYGPDEIYLRFLSETLHPLVRMDETQLAQMLKLYNKHLAADGFELIQTDEISDKPVFSGVQKTFGHSHLAEKKAAIKKYLNTAYVNAKINIMNSAVLTNTDLAIGTAKELLETTCKSILKQKAILLDTNWTLSQLINKTTGALDFKPKESEDPAKAERSIKQILAGIATIVHGLSELRNAFGTGHGKDADFIGLATKDAKLFVGIVSEIAIFFLSTNGDSAELVETSNDLPF